jgi:antitoxin HicB
MLYPVKLIRDTNGQFLVTSPDIPEMAAVGDDEAEALREAADAMETAFDFYFDDRRLVPLPSKPKRGQATVALPVLVIAKVLLHNEMCVQNIRKAELARRMDVAPPNIERIFDLKHKTKIETLESALGILGKHLELRVV